jgi:N-acetyl-gamma-glutamyl-phosphate reductase
MHGAPPDGARYRIGIAGASGYGGAETLRWLAGHPGFEVVGVTSRSNTGKTVAEVHPHLTGFFDDLRFVPGPEELLAAQPDAVVMGLPHRYAAAYANALHRIYPELRIVDLSGDHRLDDEHLYRKHYRADHPHPEQLTSGEWKYGLVEANREAIEGAKVVANPGCFATGAILAALPLARRGLIGGPVRHVAITGSSGSGIEPKPGTHHPERVEDVKAYKVLAHQHVPEVQLCLSRAGMDRATPWLMVPQSGPFARGIFTTLFVDLPGGATEELVREAFTEDYGNEPFVRLREGTPRISHVRGTNFCDVAVTVSDGVAVVMSAIDNLGKGMASQAVQNLNLMFGFDESTGLRVAGSRP